MIEFDYMGLDLIFYPKIKDDQRFHFYMKKMRKIGFFDNSLYKVFGKPTTKNYLEVLSTYIESSELRTKTIKSNAEFLKNGGESLQGSL